LGVAVAASISIACGIDKNGNASMDATIRLQSFFCTGFKVVSYFSVGRGTVK
jgi:hypothetical protein